jgi:type VI secretion system Hcp family effector
MKKSWFLLALSLVVLSFNHPTGFKNYASFKGTKQGQFKGESNKGKSGREADGWFELQSFDLGGESPVDASRSAAAGKGQHKPFTLTKEVDGATPKLLQAHVTNETLESIVIQTVNEQNQASKTITLKNAIISEIKTSGHIESISFSYDSMDQR